MGTWWGFALADPGLGTLQMIILFIIFACTALIFKIFAKLTFWK